MIRCTVALCMLILASLVPATAAASGADVLDDWRADQSIDGTYTAEELEEARATADAAELEYGNLDEQLKLAKAQQGSAGATGSSAGLPVLLLVAASIVFFAVYTLWKRRRRSSTPGASTPGASSDG